VFDLNSDLAADASFCYRVRFGGLGDCRETIGKCRTKVICGVLNHLLQNAAGRTIARGQACGRSEAFLIKMTPAVRRRSASRAIPHQGSPGTATSWTSPAASATSPGVQCPLLNATQGKGLLIVTVIDPPASMHAAAQVMSQGVPGSRPWARRTRGRSLRRRA